MTASKQEQFRRRIVEAATRLFRQYGFKRTSMDLLAREAAVAKPTLYKYFADKDALFRAVVVAVSDELLDAARHASHLPAPAEARLAEVLSAKFTRYWELVHASPHALELMDSQNRLGADIVEKCDQAYLKLLVSVIEHAEDLSPKRAGLSTVGAAQILLRAASGAGLDATTAAQHKRHLAEIVRVIAMAMKTRSARS